MSAESSIKIWSFHRKIKEDKLKKKQKTSRHCWGRFWCRCSCWLWSSAGNFRCTYFHVEPKRDQTPRSLPRFNSRHFKRRCCLNCDCEHLPAESPSKVSYNNPACESLGTPCSHYKGDQSTCPRELCLTFDLCTSTAPNNRAVVFVGHTVGTASWRMSW